MQAASRSSYCRACPRGCNRYQFCTYTSRNYTGMLGRMSGCTLHVSHAKPTWFYSYVNNQTRDTHAPQRCGSYDSLTTPSVNVVAAINRIRMGSSPAWNGCIPSPQTTGCSQNLTSSTRPRRARWFASSPQP